MRPTAIVTAQTMIDLNLAGSQMIKQGHYHYVPDGDAPNKICEAIEASALEYKKLAWEIAVTTGIITKASLALSIGVGCEGRATAPG